MEIFRLARIVFIVLSMRLPDQPLVVSSTTCSITVYIWLVVDNACHVRYHIMTSGVPRDVGHVTVKLTSSVYWNKYNTQNITEYTFDKVNFMKYHTDYAMVDSLMSCNTSSNFILLIVPRGYFCCGSFCFMSWC